MLYNAWLPIIMLTMTERGHLNDFERRVIDGVHMVVGSVTKTIEVANVSGTMASEVMSAWNLQWKMLLAKRNNAPRFDALFEVQAMTVVNLNFLWKQPVSSKKEWPNDGNKLSVNYNWHFHFLFTTCKNKCQLSGKKAAILIASENRKEKRVLNSSCRIGTLL